MTSFSNKLHLQRLVSQQKYKHVIQYHLNFNEQGKPYLIRSCIYSFVHLSNLWSISYQLFKAVPFENQSHDVFLSTPHLLPSLNHLRSLSPGHQPSKDYTPNETNVPRGHYQSTCTSGWFEQRLMWLVAVTCITSVTSLGMWGSKWCVFPITARVFGLSN